MLCPARMAAIADCAAAFEIVMNGSNGPIVFSNSSTYFFFVRSVCRLRLPWFSSSSQAHDGVGWVWIGKVETAIRLVVLLSLQNRRHVPRPPSGGFPYGNCGLGILCCSGNVYMAWKSVRSRIMACSMIASRLAKATRAFLIVDRAPIASAHDFNFSGAAYRVSITFAAS